MQKKPIIAYLANKKNMLSQNDPLNWATLTKNNTK